MLHLFLLQDCPSLCWHKGPRGRRIPLLEIIGQLFHSHEFHTIMLLEVLDESICCQRLNMDPNTKDQTYLSCIKSACGLPETSG